MPFFQGCPQGNFEILRAKIGGQTAELEQKEDFNEIQEKSNVFKQNNDYIRTKLLHNLETVNKTLNEQEQSFDKIKKLFHEQEGFFARNKNYNGEALERLKKDVKEACESLTNVDDFKTHKKQRHKDKHSGSSPREPIIVLWE